MTDHQRVYIGGYFGEIIRRRNYPRLYYPTRLFIAYLQETQGRLPLSIKRKLTLRGYRHVVTVFGPSSEDGKEQYVTAFLPDPAGSYFEVEYQYYRDGSGTYHIVPRLKDKRGFKVLKGFAPGRDLAEFWETELLRAIGYSPDSLTGSQRRELYSDMDKKDPGWRNHVH